MALLFVKLSCPDDACGGALDLEGNCIECSLADLGGNDPCERCGKARDAHVLGFGIYDDASCGQFAGRFIE